MRRCIAQRTHLDFRPIYFSMPCKKNQVLFPEKYIYFLELSDRYSRITTANIIWGKSGSMEVYPCSIIDSPFRSNSCLNVWKLTILQEVPAILTSLPVCSWIRFWIVNAVFFFTVCQKSFVGVSGFVCIFIPSGYENYGFAPSSRRYLPTQFCKELGSECRDSFAFSFPPGMKIMDSLRRAVASACPPDRRILWFESLH